MYIDDHEENILDDPSLRPQTAPEEAPTAEEAPAQEVPAPEAEPVTAQAAAPEAPVKVPDTWVRVFSPKNTVSASRRPSPARTPPPSTPSGSETRRPSIW